MRSYVLAREPDGAAQRPGHRRRRGGAHRLARCATGCSVELRAAGDPEEDRWRLLQAVTGFLRNASTVQPLLLVLEDLHWADRGTLDLLLHLARNLQGARLLIVGTYRDVEVDRAHPLSGDAGRAAARRELRARAAARPDGRRGAADAGARSPARRCPGRWRRPSTARPRATRCSSRRCCATWSKKGCVEREDGRCVARRRAAGAEHPRGAARRDRQAAVAAVSRDCNRVLAIAAVIGRDFRLDDAAARWRAWPRRSCTRRWRRRCDVGGAGGAAARPGSVRYRFAHAFFRQTLYEELIAPRRLRLHQQVARALESQYASRLEEHAAELAEHFAQSHRPRPTWRRRCTTASWRRSGRLSVYAYGEAVRHLEQALEVQEVLDPDDKAKRCDLLLALGEALVPAGEHSGERESVAPRGIGARPRRSATGTRVSEACRIVRSSPFGNLLPLLSAEFVNWARLADESAETEHVDRIYADISCALPQRSAETDARSCACIAAATELALRLDDPRGLVTSAVTLLGAAATPPEEHNERLALAEEISKRSSDGVAASRLADLHYHSEGLPHMGAARGGGAALAARQGGS